MPRDDEVVGFFLARRIARPWRGRARTRPRMPSTAWRLAALLVTTVGVLLGIVLAVAAGWSLWRWALIGGVLGFVVGMYVVETSWERRVDELGASGADGPIGPRG